MKEEKCANYERDNNLSEMEENVKDAINNSVNARLLEKPTEEVDEKLKITKEKLSEYIDKIYFRKPKREIFLMNASNVLDTRKSEIDPIVESVRQKLLDRSNVGIKKYNTTLESNNKDNYLNHLQEELMDGSLYIQKIMQQQIDITELVASESNDWELGKLLRKIYGKV